MPRQATFGGDGCSQSAASTVCSGSRYVSHHSDERCSTRQSACLCRRICTLQGTSWKALPSHITVIAKHYQASLVVRQSKLASHSCLARLAKWASSSINDLHLLAPAGLPAPYALWVDR